MLFMSQTLEEFLMSRDTVIFFFFSIRICYQFDIAHPIATSTYKISRFADEMKLFPLQRKVEKIVQMSQNAMDAV